MHTSRRRNTGCVPRRWLPGTRGVGVSKPFVTVDLGGKKSKITCEAAYEASGPLAVNGNKSYPLLTEDLIHG